MQNILYNLFNGDIIPWERQPYNLVAQREIALRLEVEEQHFLSTLTADDCRRFEAFTQLQRELSCVSEEDVFAYGFSLGLLAALDVTRYAEQMTMPH